MRKVLLRLPLAARHKDPPAGPSITILRITNDYAFKEFLVGKDKKDFTAVTGQDYTIVVIFYDFTGGYDYATITATAERK